MGNKNKTIVNESGVWPRTRRNSEDVNYIRSMDVDPGLHDEDQRIPSLLTVVNVLSRDVCNAPGRAPIPPPLPSAAGVLLFH